MYFSVNTSGTKTPTDWGAAYAPRVYDKNTQISLEEDGYINIKLNYKQNFTKDALGGIKSVWANINQYNNYYY